MGRTPNDNRSDSFNDETAAGKAAKANHERQVRENKNK